MCNHDVCFKPVISPQFVDLIECSHLLLVVLSMGAALYFDMQSLKRLSSTISQTYIDDLHDLHRLVTIAFLGLWITGAALIGVRTGYDLTEFSPKLWCKVGVVSALTLNSILLHLFIFPRLKRGIGHQLIQFPVKPLFLMTLCGGISLAGWMLALALGSSSFLKSAGWDVLLSFMSVGATLIIVSTLVAVFAVRWKASHQDRLTGVVDPTQ